MCFLGPKLSYCFPTTSDRPGKIWFCWYCYWIFKPRRDGSVVDVNIIIHYNSTCCCVNVNSVRHKERVQAKIFSEYLTYADVCILCTSYKHDADREDLLGVCVGWHVAEPHAGQTAEGEVEWSDVDAADGGAAAGPIHTLYGIVRRLQALPQLMEPSCF